ncbi:carboxymuconolactone decarboxylase family protein [Deferribacteres bacterium DY0037]
MNNRKDVVLKEVEQTMGMIPNFFKYQAEVDPDWCKLNLNRFQHIMLEGKLDRKTKEVIAVVVSILKNCNYCATSHTRMLKALGASDEEISEIYKVIELFQSFTSIANSLNVPCDI